MGTSWCLLLLLLLPLLMPKREGDMDRSSIHEVWNNQQPDWLHCRKITNTSKGLATTVLPRALADSTHQHCCGPLPKWMQMLMPVLGH